MLSLMRSARHPFTALFLGTAAILVGCGASDSDGADPPQRGASSSGADPSRPGADSRPGANGDPNDPSAPRSSSHGPFFRAAADRGDLQAFVLDDAALHVDGSIKIAEGKGHPGTDPQPTGYHGGSFYNGGAYRYAVASSPEWISDVPFDSITPSFEALAPAGTWIHVKVAARLTDGTWTKDYSLGVWAEDESTVRRHSVEGQADPNGDVATDTLDLTRPADALRMSVVLFSSSTSTATPTLRAVNAIATKRTAIPASTTGEAAALGKKLAVPMRSQMIYPNGGNAWCSPTSTSMLLGYWADALNAAGLRETPPEAAGRCNDFVYRGTGNWTFNTAHASAMDDGRLHGAVTRLGSFAQVEQLIAADIPVAISVRYGKNELSNSPIGSTDGHLIVVRGFASNGNVICNDPAFSADAKVEVTYDRAELTKVWQRSMGTTYLVWPTTKKLPVDPAGAFY